MTLPLTFLSILLAFIVFSRDSRAVEEWLAIVLVVLVAVLAVYTLP